MINHHFVQQHGLDLYSQLVTDFFTVEVLVDQVVGVVLPGVPRQRAAGVNLFVVGATFRVDDQPTVKHQSGLYDGLERPGTYGLADVKEKCAALDFYYLIFGFELYVGDGVVCGRVAPVVEVVPVVDLNANSSDGFQNRLVDLRVVVKGDVVSEDAVERGVVRERFNVDYFLGWDAIGTQGAQATMGL